MPDLNQEILDELRAIRTLLAAKPVTASAPAMLAQIVKQGDDRSRELARLKESAAKLGLQLVEVQP